MTKMNSKMRSRNRLLVPLVLNRLTMMPQSPLAKKPQRPLARLPSITQGYLSRRVVPWRAQAVASRRDGHNFVKRVSDLLLAKWKFPTRNLRDPLMVMKPAEKSVSTDAIPFINSQI
jgi:hypothetical protein